MEELAAEIFPTPDFFRLQVKKRSDKLMNYFVPFYFMVGVILAPFYNTMVFALCTGSLLLTAFYSTKWLLPGSNLYQYVLSASLAVFMAQFIYQMHGLFEMHFFAFIGSAILITYQNWKLQLPMLVVVIFHHAIFSIMQNSGYGNVYFSQLEYFDLQTFMTHILLTTIIMLICGLWAYQLKKYNEVYIKQVIKLAELQQEAALSVERKINTEILADLNKNLEQQAKDLMFSNAELERFAYAASHDLQEPLRMISYSLGLLKKKYGDIFDEKANQYMDLAFDGSKRMQQLIADLLEFSRIGKHEEMLGRVDFNEVLSQVLASLSSIISEKQAEIYRETLPCITTFKTPVGQIFQNLVSNALKYQFPGKKPVITIGCKKQAANWLCWVKDNGIGISSEYLETVFIMFKRLHSKDQYLGSGIGLSSTRKLIENLGGEIWVESVEGEGSVFYFTIPDTYKK